MKVAVSGHRPSNLGRGWKDKAFHKTVREALHNKLAELSPGLVYTGMALGVDQWAADWCIETNTPFVAAVPFLNQDAKWNRESKIEYKRLLKKASLVVQVDRMPGYIHHRVAPDLYTPEKLHTRNKWMVDQLTGKDDKLLAVIDTSFRSGTKNCVDYATSKKIPTRHILVPNLSGYSNKKLEEELPF